MALIRESLDSFDAIGGIVLDVETRLINADYELELKTTQQEVADYEAGMFAGEFDSNLNDWPALKPSTIARKGNDRILVETGALRASLVSVGGPGNISATAPRGMLFGTEVEYAIFHQEGTRKMPARPPVGMSEETLDRAVERIADSAVEKMKYA